MRGMQAGKHITRVAFSLFLLPTLCFAAPATFRVLDGSGSPIKDALIIVKSLDSGYGDVSRQLTDEQGEVHAVELKAGLFRVIATTPYGLWETAIKEFLVAERPVDLTLKLQPQPTHGFGDIVSLGNSRANLQVLRPDGIPASGAKVLVRDENATLHLERWYKLDDNGKASVELVGSPTVLVIIYSGTIFTTHLAQSDTHAVVRFP